MSEKSPQNVVLQPATEVPLTRVLATIWRGRWWVAGATLLATGLGYLHAERRGTTWQAQAMLYVERLGPTVIGPATMFGAAWNYSSMQAELIRSIPILSAALEQPEVKASPIFGDSMSKLAWLKGCLEVDVGESDDLIRVSLVSPMREEACTIVNAVVEAYREFHAKRKKDTASGLLDHLTSEMDRYKEELAKEEANKIEFLRKNPGVGMYQRAADAVASRLRDLESALTEAELETMEAEAKWLAAKEYSTDPETLRRVLPMQGEGARPDLTRTPEDAVMSSQLQALELRRLELLADVTPDHPAVVALERSIAELREQTIKEDEDFARTYVSSLELRYLSSKKKVEDLTRKVAAEAEKIGKLDPKHAEYSSIETRVESARKFFDTLYQRTREIDINQNLDNPDRETLTVLVYEYASPENSVMASSKRAILAISAFLGLMIGLGLAWLRGEVDQRLRTAEDLTAAVPAAPLLAIIPRMAIGSEQSGAVATWMAHPELAEAARSLRTAVFFGAPDLDARIVLVSSPDPGDGKSLVVSSLGMAMAQAGQRTLIVDGDLRRPRQAKLFRAANEDGLAQLVASRRPVAEAIVETGQDGLDLLPSGSVPLNPTEILNSHQLAELLTDLGERYDRILIDSPPVLAFADARILATRCDATVIATRANKTTRKGVRSACESIASVGGRILGVVLNGFPRPTSTAYGYGYGYGHGSDSDAVGGRGSRRARRKRENKQPKVLP